jgi:hypothetical protein
MGEPKQNPSQANAAPSRGNFNSYVTQAMLWLITAAWAGLFMTGVANTSGSKGMCAVYSRACFSMVCWYCVAHWVAAGLALADFVMATAYQNPLVGVNRDTLLRIG